MFCREDKTIFWGVKNLNKKIDQIIEELNLNKMYFKLKLIMSEAITNAFIHGNEGDENKPVIVKWNLEDDYIKINVDDSGEHVHKLDLKKNIEDDEILSESGRGLFLISSYCDEFEFTDTGIMMKNYIN